MGNSIIDIKGPSTSIKSGSTRRYYDLVLAEEFAKLKIQNSPYNRGWIKRCWGAGVLQDIGEYTPICSGTIMGTARGFRVLWGLMVKERRGRRRCGSAEGEDQCYLNYLARKGI